MALPSRRNTFHGSGTESCVDSIATKTGLLLCPSTLRTDRLCFGCVADSSCEDEASPSMTFLAIIVGRTTDCQCNFWAGVHLSQLPVVKLRDSGAPRPRAVHSNDVLLVNFAQRGDPNAPRLPSWPRYELSGSQLMGFDTIIAASPNRALRRTFFYSSCNRLRVQVSPRELFVTVFVAQSNDRSGCFGTEAAG
jgi:hypothetical protein